MWCRNDSIALWLAWCKVQPIAVMIKSLRSCLMQVLGGSITTANVSIADVCNIKMFTIQTSRDDVMK